MIASAIGWKHGGSAWVRLWDGGPGICVTRTKDQLFSERNNLVRVVRLFGLSFTYVRPRS